MSSKILSLYKNAYSGLSRENWWLSAAMLVNRSGTMVMPFLTLYLTRPTMGYSLSDAGMVLGLYGLGAVTGAHIGGKLTDRLGFFRVQIMALLGGGFLFMLLGQMQSFSTICIVTFLLSMVNESFRPANSTAVAFYSKEGNRTRSYALNRLAINLGWAFGTAFGGLIASINYELLFWLDGCTNILAAILLWNTLKHTRSSTEHITQKNNTSTSAYQDKKYMMYCFFVVLFACCFFQLFTNLTAFFRNELKYNERLIGLLGAINGLTITFFEMVIVYRLEGRRTSAYYIVRGVLICAVGFSSLLLLPNQYSSAILIMVIMTLGEIIALPFMNAWWINRSVSNNRGSYAALYNMSWSMAQSFGPLTGAFIATNWGFKSLWGLAAITMSLSGFGFLLVDKYSSNKQPVTS